MFKFWYSDQCSRQIKLMICIGLCIVIFGCAEVLKLPESISIASVLFGVILHFIYQFKQKKQSQNHYAYDFGFALIFILGLGLIFSFLPRNSSYEFSLLALQGFGFCLLGLCTVSIYGNRAKRFD